MLSRDLNRLEDHSVRKLAAEQIYSNDQTFALQGWAPDDSLPALKAYSKEQEFYCAAEAPAPEDNPPTLMRNPSWISAGEDLVTFYMTPGYQTWDPSTITFISFAIFFGMILSDAGYAAVMALTLMLMWKKMGRSVTGRRFRPLSLSAVAAALGFGVLVGSYFGVTPADESWLGKLHVLQMSDTNRMMMISVIIGVFHIVLANVMNAYRYPYWRDRLPSVGWIDVICSGFVLPISSSLTLAGLHELGIALMAIGALLIVLFTAHREKLLARLGQGLLG